MPLGAGAESPPRSGVDAMRSRGVSDKQGGVWTCVPVGGPEGGRKVFSAASSKKKKKKRGVHGKLSSFQNTPTRRRRLADIPPPPSHTVSFRLAAAGRGGRVTDWAPPGREVKESLFPGRAHKRSGRPRPATGPVPSAHRPALRRGGAEPPWRQSPEGGLIKGGGASFSPSCRDAFRATAARTYRPLSCRGEPIGRAGVPVARGEGRGAGQTRFFPAFGSSYSPFLLS